MKISVQETISASTQAVYDAMIDFLGRPDVLPAVMKCEVLTEGDVAVGTRFRETREMFGREASEEMEITELVPGEAVLLEAHSHGMHYLTRYAVAAAGEGATLTVTFEGRPETLMARLMGFVAKMFEGATAKALKQDLGALRASVEGRG